ncbi:YciI family protein [Schumannella sp. 10F1B-5-1]|uniref:YciI family protein n=1 Tax=Schumannella sp. 10F1B-5-1 TaxID=2590780 RepID=UPI0011300BFE|nr:YciI family protein [Schumannella sp. 10F1B-5-1]TPW70181.1 hypothetical protein FJ658_14275 [Schumannella sp. 10F1B-5-1]
MFVVVLDYVVPLDEVDAALEAHAEWLDEHYATGLFLASGRRSPRVGGVIFAAGSAAAVAAAVAADPFATRGIATHTVIEFHPSRFAGAFDSASVRESLAAPAV